MSCADHRPTYDRYPRGRSVVGNRPLYGYTVTCPCGWSSRVNGERTEAAQRWRAHRGPIPRPQWNPCAHCARPRRVHHGQFRRCRTLRDIQALGLSVTYYTPTRAVGKYANAMAR